MKEVRISNFFSKTDNIQDVILSELDNAETNIKVAIAWFTNPVLFEKLYEKAETGIRVELIITYHDINKSSGLDYNSLNDVGGLFIDLYVDNGFMHNKFCVIDDHTVINGSYNWTRKANSTNQENITVISNDPKTCYDFINEFEKLKNLGGSFSDKSALDLKRVFELFNLFKAFISIGDSQKIFPYLIELNGVEDVEIIVGAIKNENFEYALEEIERFEKSHTQLETAIDLEKQILQTQVRLISSEIQNIETQKSEVERLIEQFNHRYIIELHPISLKILKFKKAVYEKINKHSGVEDYDSILEEFERIKEDLIAKEGVEMQDLSLKKKEKMKTMFRESASLCHPDSPHCIFESEQEANSFFSNLTIAYKKNDLETVQNLWKELKAGNPKNYSDLNLEISILKAKLETLKSKRRKLSDDLLELINSETYKIIESLDNWNDYFSKMKLKLETQYKELKQKFM